MTFKDNQNSTCICWQNGHQKWYSTHQMCFFVLFVWKHVHELNKTKKKLQLGLLRMLVLLRLHGSFMFCIKARNKIRLTGFKKLIQVREYNVIHVKFVFIKCKSLEVFEI